MNVTAKEVKINKPEKLGWVWHFMILILNGQQSTETPAWNNLHLPLVLIKFCEITVFIK